MGRGQTTSSLFKLQTKTKSKLRLSSIGHLDFGHVNEMIWALVTVAAETKSALVTVWPEPTYQK